MIEGRSGQARGRGTSRASMGRKETRRRSMRGCASRSGGYCCGETKRRCLFVRTNISSLNECVFSLVTQLQEEKTHQIHGGSFAC